MMTSESRSRNTLFALLRALGLAVIGFGVLGLQVAMFQVSREIDGREEPGKRSTNFNSYGRWLLHLDDAGSPSFLSGAVCGDDLTILVETRLTRTGEYFQYYFSGEDFHEIIQCNLRSGRSRTSHAPPFVDQVLSDGETLFWIRDPGGHEERSTAFLWDGRPVGLIPSYSDGFTATRLVEYIDGDPRETGVYVLLPGGFDSHFDRIQSNGNELRWLTRWDAGFDMYQRKGLPTGTKQEAEEFAKRYSWTIWQLNSVQLDEIGWKRTRITVAEDIEHTGHFHSNPFGFWFEGQNLYVIGNEWDENDVPLFRICRYEEGQLADSKLIRLLIRDGFSFKELDAGAWHRIVSSADGDVFVISRCYYGRLQILKWDKGQFRLIAKRGSPRIRTAVLGCSAFVSFVILLPMLALGLMTWVLQRWLFRVQADDSIAGAPSASCLRRGTARLIDVSIPAILCALSILLHPDAIVWWGRVERTIWSIKFDVASLFQDSAPYILQILRRSSGNIFLTAISAPVVWNFFLPAVAFILVQIVWQGCSGRTLGKWLLGLRALRTTLRPCGIPRSLLREILFMIDSMLLLSWVPGVIAILATKSSQRIGDLLADTIVTRDPAHRSINRRSLDHSPGCESSSC